MSASVNAQSKTSPGFVLLGFILFPFFAAALALNWFLLALAFAAVVKDPVTADVAASVYVAAEVLFGYVLMELLTNMDTWHIKSSLHEATRRIAVWILAALFVVAIIGEVLLGLNRQNYQQQIKLDQQQWELQYSNTGSSSGGLSTDPDLRRSVDEGTGKASESKRFVSEYVSVLSTLGAIILHILAPIVMALFGALSSPFLRFLIGVPFLVCSALLNLPVFAINILTFVFRIVKRLSLFVLSLLAFPGAIASEFIAGLMKEKPTT